MEIVLLVILFVAGTISSAIQAMKYLERRQQRKHDMQDDQTGTGKHP